MSLRRIDENILRCTMVREYECVLEWRPEKQIVAGTQVELRSAGIRTFHTWAYVRSKMEKADVNWRWKVNPTQSEVWHNRQRVIFRAKLPYGLNRGEPCLIRLSVIPPVWADSNETLSIWTVDIPNNFNPNAPEPEPERACECELPVVAAPVERLSVYSRPMPNVDGRVRTCIVPEDRFGNPSAFAEPVTARIQWLNEDTEQPLQGTHIMETDGPSDIARMRVSVRMEGLALDENVRNGVREAGWLSVTGNPVWPAPSGGRRPAFGEFHWHTRFSGDGIRDINDAVRSARDEVNLDYVSSGDHNPRGEKWTETVAAMERFDEPGSFATFFGWENGTDRGHENYYFTDPNHPLVCGGDAGIGGGHPDELIPKLRELDDFIAIPHHTNAVAETRKLEDDSPFWHPYPWTEPTKYIRLVEIMQTRGNQERNVYSDVWRGWHQNHNASVQDALALGYRVGFAGGTDNHCGWPGRAWSKRESGGVHPPKSVILTGVWTEGIDRQAVFQAMYDRHTWAVWDTRAILHFTINGVLMGGELTLPPAEKLTGRLRLSAEDALQSVEVVSGGNAVWAESFDSADVDVEVPLGEARDDAYFYVRALQRNGGIIYGSPVFIQIAR